MVEYDKWAGKSTRSVDGMGYMITGGRWQTLRIGLALLAILEQGMVLVWQKYCISIIELPISKVS